MSDEIINKAYERVDNLLKSLRDNGSGSLYGLGELYDTEGQMAKNLLVEHNLISFQMGYVSTDSAIDISASGINVLKAGGIKKYLLSINQKTEEKENLELQQLRSDNILKTNQLIDYDTTKRQLKYSMIANVVLAVIGLIELLLLITKK